MKTWIYLIVMFITAGINAWAADNLVENGNFSHGAAGWHLVMNDGYPLPGPEFHIGKKVLEVESLQGVSPPYLVLMQAVEIRKGRRYRLSYDIRGGTGRYVVSVRHLRKEKHYHAEQKITSDWQTVTIEFEGAFDTEARWVKRFREAAVQGRLEEDRWAPNRDLTLLLAENDPEPGPSRSMLVFSLGEISGTMALRNVSLAELGPPGRGKDRRD